MSTPPQNPEKVSLELVPQPDSISKPSKRKNAKPTEKDLKRWARWKTRTPDEDIARDEHVPLQKVRESIQRVLAYQQSNSIEIVTPRVHEVILNRLGDADQVIADLAQATRTREVAEKTTMPDGTVIETKKLVAEADHRIRRTAIDALKDLRDMVASKETRVSVNSGTQIGALNIGSRSFEERMRTKRAQNGLTQEENSEPAEIEAEFEDIDDPDNSDDRDNSDGQAETDESPTA
jgi:hypothetical protein